MSAVIKKKSTFFRSASLEKLKCTAALIYPLTGLKLSTDKSLWENSLFIQSRTQMYRSYLSTSTAISDLLCAILVWILDVLAKLSVINLSVASEIISKHKLRHKRCHIRQQDSVQQKIVAVQKKLIIKSRPINQDDADLGLVQLFDDLSYSPIVLASRKLLLNPEKVAKPAKSGFLKCGVYSSVCLIYIKLNLLILALFGAPKNPPGLFFLLICVGLIGMLVLRMLINGPKRHPKIVAVQAIASTIKCKLN